MYTPTKFRLISNDRLRVKTGRHEKLEIRNTWTINMDHDKQWWKLCCICEFKDANYEVRKNHNMV